MPEETKKSLYNKARGLKKERSTALSKMTKPQLKEYIRRATKEHDYAPKKSTRKRVRPRSPVPEPKKKVAPKKKSKIVMGAMHQGKDVGNASLRKIIGLKKGEKISKIEATKKLHQYIKNKGLQKKTDGRIILPNAELRKALKVPKDVELSYFNLQTYLGPQLS